MNLCFRVAEIEKGYGKRDLSKLTKKQITDKNGHLKNVYVKNGEDVEQGKGKAAEPSNTSKDGRFTVGDIVTFESGGEERTGKVLGGKGDVVQIDGQGNSSGIRYTVNVSDVKDKVTNADGTIPASKFNANDYKKAFTDPKCTNNVEGIQYVYSLLGEEGKRTQAEVESKLNAQTKRMKSGDTLTRNMKDGKLTPERQKLHDEIIKSILTEDVVEACKPKNGEKPKFVMFGGRGGSGKSWFTDKKRAAAEGRKVMFEGIQAATGKDENGNITELKQDFDKNANNFLILDADAIKNSLPEFEGWNAGEVHEESSILMKTIKKLAMNLGLNVIIDGTMNYNSKKPDKVRNDMLEAKDKGYGLEAHYMFLPLQDSCIRAFNRFKTRKGDYSGRLVPTDIMLAMQDNEKSFDSVKDIVDDWSFRDNQGTSGPKLISKKGL